MFLESTSVLALVGAISSPVASQEAQVAAVAAAVTADAADDAQIVVTGQRDEYGARATRSATRTDTDPAM